MESRNREIRRKEKHTAISTELINAEVLAKIYMKSRPEFLSMNMEEVTNHWNLNFIFDFLFYVRNLSDIDLAIEWLAESWAEAHHLYESYSNIKDPKLVEEHRRFVLSLNDVKDSLIRCFEAEERKEALRVQMLMGYKGSDETDSPQFEASDSSGISEYHIKDLPEDVQKVLAFHDDETYTLFVKNMNEKTWDIVKTNKSKYLDRLRFVCNKHGITVRSTDRKQFDILLHTIIPDLGKIGNLKSAMKKQKDSNDELNYINYDSPVSYQRNKCSELCKVGAELEECLTPVLEKIHHKKWNIKKNPR